MRKLEWFVVGCLALSWSAHAESEKPCEHRLARGICAEKKTDARDRGIVRLCRRGACVTAFAMTVGEEDRIFSVDNKHADRPVITVADHADPPQLTRRVPVVLPPLERQLVEREVDAHLLGDRFARALPIVERALGETKTDRGTLEWQRVAALYGLGRIDEALAAWRPLVAANPVRAYAAAARYGVLRPTLDQPEIVSQRAPTPGTARIHADGTFAGGAIAFAPGRKDVAVIESEPCGDGDQHWLAVGAIPIPLGRYSDYEGGNFRETGVTVGNRFLRDFGYRFDPDAEPALACEGDPNVRYLKRAKLWMVGRTLRRAPPNRKIRATECEYEPSVHEDPPRATYVPTIGRAFRHVCAMRGCGDGGRDPQYWEEIPLRR